MAAHSHLPHWNRDGVAVFLTWRLAGSLPAIKFTDVHTSHGAKFVAFDRLLDARASGPKWLGQSEVAQAVVEVLRTGDTAGYYELGSWVIMPNHVHLLIRPMTDISRIVSGIKYRSSRDANRILKRTGAFWSRDYFDRCVRNMDEEGRIVRYIEYNPVQAGLCRTVSDWPYSSARQRA